MSQGNQGESSRTLQGSDQFQAMPAKIRVWILESPNATRDFAEFFQRGGEIEPRADTLLPYYREEQPPKIYVNEGQWSALTHDQGAPEWPQRHLFGTLAHEIGHDRFNTGSVLFNGRTAEEYVQYRAGLEANAIFTAFPIFKDLERLDAFKTSKPFGSIGYLNEIELGALYGDWKAGRLDDHAVVEQITAKVASAPYTLSNPPSDLNRDGVTTHRDAYLRDYSNVVERKQAPPQASVGLPVSPADPRHPDNGMLQQIRTGVRSIDERLGKPYDDISERISRCLLAACKDNRDNHPDVRDYSLSANALNRVDHVVMGGNGNLFAVEGRIDDPAHKRAHVSTQEAIHVPVEQSDQKLLAAHQAIAHEQHLAQQQELSRGLNPPARSGPVHSM